MNEILQPYLVQLLELVKTTGSFIIGELPSISKEIITWGIVGNIIPIVSLLLIIGILIMSATIVKKSTDTSKYAFFETNHLYDFYHWQTNVWLVLMIISGVLVIIWITILCLNIGDIFKAIFAPRLFLIEQIKSMM